MGAKIAMPCISSQRADFSPRRAVRNTRVSSGQRTKSIKLSKRSRELAAIKVAAFPLKIMKNLVF